MKKSNLLRAALSLALTGAVLLYFWTAVSQLEWDREIEGKQQLEDVLHRTATACYAAEGFYPPNMEYMRQHYGIQFDEERYTVRYDVFASNLMPDITVLDNEE